MEVAVAVDAKGASTAPWKTAKGAVFHNFHRLYQLASITLFGDEPFL